MARPILIIEDDPDIAASLKFNLEREGLTTVSAATGEGGLSEAQEEEDDDQLPGKGS
jgi:DNA-binding response OmpR family regulator